ncbi:hypothetical protein R8Z50_20840 [Longispora sp. K20-0274]|uniref:hypothetical protein n=1 Tax=Longispora sp. K20-0274 TaxID=3088255 RepID=UPI00399BE93D
MDDHATRRRLLQAGAALGLATVGLAGAAPASATPLKLTPSCTDGDETASQMEGPFFKRNSPERANLVVGGVTGVLLGLRGFVYTRQCVPVPSALLEFWQADRAGAYDRPLAPYADGLARRARADYVAAVRTRPYFLDWMDLHRIDRRDIVDPWGQLDEPLPT